MKKVTIILVLLVSVWNITAQTESYSRFHDSDGDKIVEIHGNNQAWLQVGGLGGSASIELQNLSKIGEWGGKAKSWKFIYDNFTSPTQPLSIKAAGTNILVAQFLNNGNVGIGVASPSEKLVVNGIIESTGMKVKNVVNSDFVFEDDYKLRSIEEVEAFIKQNKHLPDVPPAEETLKGVELAQFTNLMLQKVEELTLYIIELKKENNELRQLIENK